MTMQTDPVTPVANPDQTANTNPAPSNTEAVNPPETSQSPTRTMPDEAYKGIQRQLEREKNRVRELESQISQVSNQPADGATQAVIMGLIGEIGKSDPARAEALSSQYNALRLAQENQSLRTRFEQEAQEKQYRELAEQSNNELREVVRALGADPDSPLIDYGNDDEWFATRLSRVRASAMAAAKPAQAVTPPSRSVADGTGHNVQPGTPPPPPSANAKEVTQDELMAAQREYAVAYQTNDATQRAAAEAKLRTLNDQYAKQVFGS